MMPIPICRKGRRLEKVENSTALHARRMILLTSEQIRSRLRYPLLIICNYLTEHRATQDDSIQCQRHDQPNGMPVAPATPRDSSGTTQAAASRLISTLPNPCLSPCRAKNAIATASTTRS